MYWNHPDFFLNCRIRAEPTTFAIKARAPPKNIKKSWSVPRASQKTISDNCSASHSRTELDFRQFAYRPPDAAGPLLFKLICVCARPREFRTTSQIKSRPVKPLLDNSREIECESIFVATQKYPLPPSLLLLSPWKWCCRNNNWWRSPPPSGEQSEFRRHNHHYRTRKFRVSTRTGNVRI